MAYQIDDDNIVRLLEEYDSGDADMSKELMRYAAQRIKNLEAELESVACIIY